MFTDSSLRNTKKKMYQVQVIFVLAWCVTSVILLDIMEYSSAVIIRIGYFWLDAVNYVSIQWALMVLSHPSLLLTTSIVRKVSYILIRRYCIIYILPLCNYFSLFFSLSLPSPFSISLHYIFIFIFTRTIMLILSIILNFRKNYGYVFYPLIYRTMLLGRLGKFLCDVLHILLRTILKARHIAL